MMNDFTIGDINAAIAIEERLSDYFMESRERSDFADEFMEQISRGRLEALKRIRDTFNG